MLQSLIDEYGFWILSLLGVLNLIATFFVWTFFGRSLGGFEHEVILSSKENHDNWLSFWTEHAKLADKLFPAASKEGTSQSVFFSSPENFPGNDERNRRDPVECSESFENSPIFPSDAPETLIEEINISFAPGVTSIVKRKLPAGK